MEADLKENSGQNHSTGWITVVIFPIICLSLYFGAPCLLIYPFVKITGELPPTIDTMFKPIDWLEQNSGSYRKYIIWQSELLYGSADDEGCGMQKELNRLRRNFFRNASILMAFCRQRHSSRPQVGVGNAGDPWQNTFSYTINLSRRDYSNQPGGQSAAADDTPGNKQEKKSRPRRAYASR